MSTIAIPLANKDKYENNLLVVLDGTNNEMTISKKSHDPKVIGVTTDYDDAELGLNDFGENPHRLVAVTGRILCYVKGPIGYGDCVVTSNEEGIGQKLDQTKYVPGCIIGKSLTTIKDNSVELIEMVLTTA
ncbi:hypothetical protein EB001_00665 [bacterium]|nr:hypothetical protein [bacterium]